MGNYLQIVNMKIKMFQKENIGNYEQIFSMKMKLLEIV